MKNLVSWFSKLLDMTNETVSMSSFFLLTLTIIGLILLVVPAIVLLIEVYYNHTINTNLSDMAAYITSVSTLFATGGIIKGWSTYTHNKFSNNGN